MSISVFRSTGSYEPDQFRLTARKPTERFRSTGSYEPDRNHIDLMGCLVSFDPQALTSLTNPQSVTVPVIKCFDPQALTSLTLGL